MNGTKYSSAGCAARNTSDDTVAVSKPEIHEKESNVVYINVSMLKHDDNGHEPFSCNVVFHEKHCAK